MSNDDVMALGQRSKALRVGKTDWQWTADNGGGPGTEQLTIAPMGKVARNLAEILKSIPNQHTGAGQILGL